jgi:hypothetical protein
MQDNNIMWVGICVMRNTVSSENVELCIFANYISWFGAAVGKRNLFFTICPS